MKPPILSVALMCGLAATAHAAMPPFNAECPAGLSVHADKRGSVYVNGKAAQLKRFNDNYVEARDAERGVTVSIGLASLRDLGAGPRSAQDLLAAADRSLYRAKQTGRNRVEPSRVAAG